MKIRLDKINLTVRSQFRLNLMENNKAYPQILVTLEKELLDTHLKSLSTPEMEYYLTNKKDLLQEREVEYNVDNIKIMADVEREILQMN